MTLNRVQKFVSENDFYEYNIYVIGNISTQHILEFQLSNYSNLNFIYEPEGRDSAAVICLATLLGKSDDYTYIFSCDHLIEDKAFDQMLTQSFMYINDNIITFGVKPTYPNTGFGYIKVDGYETKEFVEKPTIEIATEYIKSKNYLWNSGIFGFKNENMRNCFQKITPHIWNICIKAFNDMKFPMLLGDDYSNCEKISFDYAIMEKKDLLHELKVGLITIPLKGEWADIGNFKSIWENFNKDKNNNLLIGDISVVETNNCYIDSPNIPVATLGLENLTIINTEDCLLVSTMDKTSDIKKITSIISQTKNKNLLHEHKLVHRPWGWYKNIEGNDLNGFKVKRIAVYPAKRLSLQSHNKRSEHWVIVRGEGMIQLGINHIYVKKGDHIFIPVKEKHRITNTGVDLLEFTETQIGEYLGEDDIIRYEDDYGRQSL